MNVVFKMMLTFQGNTAIRQATTHIRVVMSVRACADARMDDLIFEIPVYEHVLGKRASSNLTHRKAYLFDNSAI